MRHRTLWVATLAAVGVFLVGSDARAANYATIVLSVNVARPADAVWKKIGGFCEIGPVLKMRCVYASGHGSLGTVRRLGGRIDEVMVAQTAHSYTYTQPNSKILYHGTVDVQAEGPSRSKIIYSLFYDQSNLKTPAARAKARKQRSMVFTRVLETMKRIALGGSP